ncbi:hypothetical protein AAG906_015432 [Vitis piasezkii]
MWLIMKVFLLQILAFLVFGGGIHCQASTRRLTFVEASYTRLCSAKNILTKWTISGPTIYAMKGERSLSMFIREKKTSPFTGRHGVTMPRYPWTDGPEYITQCPIQPGSKFTQKIILSTEEGTLWWHAHSDWTRATVHGAIIIYPKNGTKYPFHKPNAEVPIILGEWWKRDVNEVRDQGLATGGDPNSSIFYTLSMNSYPCINDSCAGPNGTRFSSSINNISFHTPTVDILEAYYYNISGVYGNNFPSFPPLVFDFTYDYLPLIYQLPSEVRVLEYNSTVEIVLQGTAVLAETHHPMHLHGYSFYVVGWGFRNFDENRDPLHYNLVDPPLQNTISVPSKGWVAIRFKASNPGVWFFHCHVERHVTWGMETAFIVKNGKHPEAQMLPPPSDMPPC